jgi:hypothetical protein
MERVVSVNPLENHFLELEFADGFRKVIDLHAFIREGLSSALLDPAYFRQVKVEDGGGIAWENGYDFCPNFLRDDIPAVHR